MIPESSRSGTGPPDRAALYVVSLFFQDGRGLSPLGSGLSTFPEALGVMAGAQLRPVRRPDTGRTGQAGWAAHSGGETPLSHGGGEAEPGRRDLAESRRGLGLAEPGDHLRGQALGVLGRLEHRREKDQFRPGRGDLAQLADAVGGRARDGGGLDVR
jgi:hypothetical protein